MFDDDKLNKIFQYQQAKREEEADKLDPNRNRRRLVKSSLFPSDKANKGHTVEEMGQSAHRDKKLNEEILGIVEEN